MIKVKKVRRGSTLIEVVIAIVIIAIMMIPIGNVVMRTVKVNKDAEVKQKATNIAYKALDEFANYTELEVDQDAVDPRRGQINLGDSGRFDVEIDKKTISLDNGRKEISAGDNGKYIVEYKIEKNPDISQDLTYDTTKEVDKYAAKLEFTENELKISSDKVGDEFSLCELEFYSNIANTRGATDIYLHIVQENVNGYITAIELYRNESDSTPFKRVRIDNPSSRSIKILQTKEYKDYARRNSNNFVIHASTEVSSDDKVANVEVFDVKDINSTSNNDITVLIEDIFKGTLCKTPKYSRKTLVNEEGNAKPLGDLYNLTVSVKKKENGEEKEIYKGTSSSNIFTTFN